MPRSKLIYTHLFPYHIRARSNNREWFHSPRDTTWLIFLQHLSRVREKFGFVTHAFVLMDNHYHLLGSTSEQHDLGEVMCWFQTSVSRKIGRSSGRINHIFGGGYKASLITHPNYFHNVVKYIYQNPLRARICDFVEEYPYSTIHPEIRRKIRCEAPQNGMSAYIPHSQSDLRAWVNCPGDPEIVKSIKVALHRTRFALKDRSTRKHLTDIRF